VPPLDEKSTHPTAPVVPIPGSDSGARLQGVSGVEGPTKGPVGTGVEGDRDVEETVENLGPPGR